MVKKLKRLKIPCLVVVITTVLMLCLGAVAASADTSSDTPISGNFIIEVLDESSFGFSVELSGLETHFPCTAYLTVSGFDTFELNFSDTPDEAFAEGSVYCGYSDDSISINYNLPNEGYGEPFLSFYAYGLNHSFDYDSELSFTLSFTEPIPSESSPLEFILNLFAEVGSWFGESLGSMLSLFWVDNKLTFLGVLAVVPLAFSVGFLIIGILQRFLSFGG